MRLCVVCLAVALTCAARAEPSVSIGDQAFYLVYAPPDSPDFVREYLPRGQKLIHWSRMVSVRVFPKEKNAARYLDRVGKQVVHSHPAAKAILLRSDQTGETILDFLMFTRDESPVAEWNLMRARYEKEKGLVVYQYAMRIYVVDHGMPETIKAERMKVVDLFAKATFKEEANQARATPRR